MRIIFSVLMTIFMLGAGIAHSQTSMPKPDILFDDASYKKHEKEVLYCIDWMDKNTFDKKNETARDAAAFIVAWCSGCPYVTMEINPKTLPFTESNPEMIIYFMGGWAKYAIEHPADSSKVKGTLAGLQSVVKAYKAHSSYARNADIDAMASRNESGKLEAWVEEQLK